MDDIEGNCFNEDYLHHFIVSNKKFPFFLKKHIQHCHKCQRYIIAINEKSSIPKSIFGKPFLNVLKSWKVSNFEILNNSERVTFFGRMYPFFIKYKKLIEIIGYGSIIFGLAQLYLYLWN